MLQEFIRAFLMIFFAEMGDKSQLLAMAFASRYPLKKVLLGLFVGIFLNHALAVLLGALLGSMIDLNWMMKLAGLAFLIFSYLSLQKEEKEEEDTSLKRGVLLTVAMAFFAGELGDKTQLAAITLSAESNHPLLILSATVSGMLTTGLIGILIGRKMGERIPQFAMRMTSGLLFYSFGSSKLVESFGLHGIRLWVFLLLSALPLIVLSAKRFAERHQLTRLQRGAQHLKEHYDALAKGLEAICLHPEHCGRCQGEVCPVGYAKLVLKNQQLSPFDKKQGKEAKPFEPSLVESEWQALKEHLKDHPQDLVLNRLKSQLEVLRDQKK